MGDRFSKLSQDQDQADYNGVAKQPKTTDNKG